MTSESEVRQGARRSAAYWLWGGLLASIAGFVLVSVLVMFSVTDHLDDTVFSLVQSARGGPADGEEGWLTPFMRDVTALGSVAVLSLFTIVVSGMLFLHGLRRRALAGAALIFSGMLANNGLKMLFSRSRPELVPHDTMVFTSSFPSGHAMMAALVYPLLVLLLADRIKRQTGLYLFGVAVLVIVIIGWSRIYLGVHWPSDIIAGWLAGGGWACGAALILTSARPGRVVQV